MNNQLLIAPIGTVVLTGENIGVTIGYEFIQKDNRLQLAYLVVPYPAGFTKPHDIKIIRAAECEILSQGLDSKQFQCLSKFLSGFCQAIYQFSPEEIIDALSNLEVDYRG